LTIEKWLGKQKMLANYEEYATESLKKFAERKAAKRSLLVDAVKDLRPARVLDLGCGAGLELFAFLEKTGAVCIGIDSAEELGKITAEVFEKEKRAVFVRSEGENLPFENRSFDVVLCRVSLPYMNNRAALAEISRVLKPGGVLLLKTHAPLFYFGMIFERLKTLSAKKTAYPLICLAASFWHLLTGKQLQKGFWKGKEIFQTRSFLNREFAKNNLKFKGFLPDNNPRTPSFIVVKMVLLKMFLVAQIFSETVSAAA
jgi:ubiquinone/menaquinone biosynthesis C-methylase UbiE